MVVPDLLNQISNDDAMWSFHCRMWYSWNVEVNVLLVDCKVELVVRVGWRNVEIFFRSKLFFHYVYACAWFQRFPCSIVSMLDANVFRLHKFPCSFWRAKSFVQTFIINLLWTGRFTLNNEHIFRAIKFPPSITDWFGFWLGWLGEFYVLNFSKRLLNEFTDWLLFNCRTQFIISFGPIVIVQWDPWWWSRKYVWFSIQNFSSLQFHNFWNTLSWKCSLKDDCIPPCLIEC